MPVVATVTALATPSHFLFGSLKKKRVIAAHFIPYHVLIHTQNGLHFVLTLMTDDEEGPGVESQPGFFLHALCLLSFSMHKFSQTLHIPPTA